MRMTNISIIDTVFTLLKIKDYIGQKQRIALQCAKNNLKNLMSAPAIFLDIQLPLDKWNCQGTEENSST